MPKKILEISGKTWQNGIAFQPSSTQGGLFSQATNFNPFDVLDMMSPSRAPVRYGNATVTKQIQYFANFMNSNSAFTYGYAGAGATTGLYQIASFDGAVLDKSAFIDTSASARGCIVWSDNTNAGNYFIYAQDTAIRANGPVPVDTGTDGAILTAGVTSAEHKFCPGADGNLYFTNGNTIGKITATVGTVGNIGNAFEFPKGFTVRDIANDGRYLVIVADDQTNTLQPGINNVIVGYWDYASEQLTQRFDIQLHGVVAVQIMDGNSHIFSRDGLYISNVSSYPQLVFPFTGNSSLTNHYPILSSQVVKKEANTILWADSNTAGIYGYGNLGIGDKKVMFHQATIGAGTCKSIAVQGLSPSSTNLLVGSSVPSLYLQGISSTKDEAILITSTIRTPQPYSLSYIRLVLRDVLASGESVAVTMTSQNGSGLPSNSQTFSYSGNGAKQSIIFTPSGATRQIFNEFYLTIDSVKAAIQSIEVWGEPQSLIDQTI